MGKSVSEVMTSSMTSRACTQLSSLFFSLDTLRTSQAGVDYFQCPSSISSLTDASRLPAWRGCRRHVLEAIFRELKATFSLLKRLGTCSRSCTCTCGIFTFFNRDKKNDDHLFFFYVNFLRHVRQTIIIS